MFAHAQLRRSTRGALLFPLLLATPLAAQVLPVPTVRIDAPKQVAVVVAWPAKVPQALLVAPDAATLPFGGAEVLANGVLAGFHPMTALAEHRLPLLPALAAQYGLHLQAVVLDQNGLVAGPVMPAARLFDPLVPDEHVHVAPGRIDEVRAVLRFDYAANETTLLCTFEATSDGYALGAIATLRHADTTDVWLALKTPGPGEGMLDIAQTLTVEVPLGLDYGTKVRLFGIEGHKPFAVPLDRYEWFRQLPNVK